MIRTITFWSACIGIVLILGPVFLLLAAVDKSKRSSELLAVFWSWVLMKIARAPLKIIGKENLKKYDRFIIVLNHQSYMDIFALIVALKKVPHFLAKKELFKIPIFGQCLKAIDVIEIDRDNRENAIRSIKKALSKGLKKPIAIFPEGTRSIDGNILPFRKKGLFLLMETGLKFIPAAFYGTREVLAKGSFKVRSHPICLAVGSPLDVPKGLSEEEKDRLRQLLREEIIKLRNIAKANVYS